MTDNYYIVESTRCWLEQVVIAHNFCPFASSVHEKESIRFSVINSASLEVCLQALIDECELLDSNESIETTLLIYSDAFKDFKDYLDLVELAQQLLKQQDYEGIYQLASFHPDYVFAGADNDDAANYTNRSPYPMLHLLREVSIEKALASYPEPEKIPERNIEYARSSGLDKMRTGLDACYNIKKK